MHPLSSVAAFAALNEDGAGRTSVACFAPTLAPISASTLTLTAAVVGLAGCTGLLSCRCYCRREIQIDV